MKQKSHKIGEATDMTKRPLCIFCVIFLIMLFCTSFFYDDRKLLITVISSLIFIFSLTLFCLKKSRRIIPIILIALACALSSLLSYLTFDSAYKAVTDRYIGEERECTVRITRITRKSTYYWQHEATVLSIDGEATSIRAIYRTSYQSFLEIGDTVSVKADISPSREDNSLSGSYYLSKGFRLILDSETDNAELITAKDTGDIHSAVSLFARAVYIRLLSTVREDTANIIQALICADKTNLEKEISVNFRILGLSHMLAVSGMHIGIIVGFLSALIKLLPIGRKRKSAIMLLILAAYVTICSFTPSVCRSFCMIALLFLEPFSKRHRDPVTSLFAAVTAICIISPYSIIDIGLIASFASTLGILTVGTGIVSALESRIGNRFIRMLIEPAVLTYSASLFMIPVSAFCFGSISVISPVSNILFLPIISLIMYLSPILLILSFSPITAYIPSVLLNFLCFILKRLSELLAYDGFLMSLGYTSLKLISVLVFLLIAIIVFGQRSCGKILLPIIYSGYIASVILINLFAPNGYVEPFAVSDGKNDAIILINKRNAMIIDNSASGAAFLGECAKAVGKYGATPEILVLTHYHNTMTRGLEKLISEYRLKQVIIMNADEKSIEKASELCLPENVGITPADSNLRLVFGEHAVEIFTFNIERSVHKCVFVHVDYNNRSTVYLGASSWESNRLTEALTSHPPDRIIAGCHGPKIKTVPVFPDSFSDIPVIPSYSDEKGDKKGTRG